MSYNIIEEFATIAILHNHVELFFSLNNFIELNDIWMPNFLEDLDFPSNSFNIFLIMDFIFLKNLYSNLRCQNHGTYLFISQSVLAKFHLSKGTLAKMFTYIISLLWLTHDIVSNRNGCLSLIFSSSSWWDSFFNALFIFSLIRLVISIGILFLSLISFSLIVFYLNGLATVIILRKFE